MNNSQINLQLVSFLTTMFENDKGNSFANIKNYVSKGNNEIADHKVNLNFKYRNAQMKDLKALQAIDINDFDAFKAMFDKALTSKVDYLTKNKANAVTVSHFANVLPTKLTFAQFQLSYIKLYDSLVQVGDKCYNGETKVQTEQSKAVIDTYDYLTPSIKVHKENDTIYINAKTESKKVISKGILNETKNGIDVFIKDTLSKDFLSTKYRMYIIDRIELFNAFKNSFEFNGKDYEVNL